MHNIYGGLYTQVLVNVIRAAPLFSSIKNKQYKLDTYVRERDLKHKKRSELEENDRIKDGKFFLLYRKF